MNRMIAGSGISHSERFDRARREGGPIHAIQSWVALPDGQEEIAPAFAHHQGKGLFLVSGDVEVDDRAVGPTQLALFSTKAEAVVQATTPSVLMLLGAHP
jgi:redox-sensitive bicupin YhaK (pirin superfamily)